jgi:hypothetical protein
MANPQAVRALLKDLKRVGSPVQRVKLLALAWRTVRELSPEERSEIASELGMKELSGLMERLGRKKDGVAPAEVLQALEQVDELDPKKVGSVLRGLWARGTRKEAVRDGLEMLGRIFEEPEPDEEATEAPAVTEPAVTEVEPGASAVGVPGVSPVVSPTVAEPAVEESEIAAVEPIERPETVERPQTMDEAPAPSEGVPEEELAPVVPSGAIPPSPDAEPPFRLIEEPSSVIEAAPEPERPSDKPVVPPPGGPVAALESVPSLSRRFRIVRELFASGGGVPEESLETLVEQFPDGWQRRRVLCTLFRNGLPSSTRRALEMIGTLERSVDRRWCAATLADTRDLSPAEIDDLLRRFPFRGLGRRLRPVRKIG